MNIRRIIREEIDKGYYIIEDESGPMLIHYEDLMRQEPEQYEVIKILHTSDFDKAKYLYYKYLNNPLNESDGLEWINKIEPKLTKDLILCANHERFNPGCMEILNVSDRMVYTKSLETGERYADPITDVMMWLTDGDYLLMDKTGELAIPLKESDFDWTQNPIEVGKCFRVYNWDGNGHAIVTIKEMEQREWKDNIRQKGGEFNPDDIIIHLVGVTQKDKKRVGPNFRISYNDLVENINDGYLAPTDCGNSINESDGLEWISDVKTNQDIAQEIANKSEIKDNKLSLPFLSHSLSSSHFSSLLLLLSSYIYPPSSFAKYCKEQYGLIEEDLQDVWNRYKNIIIDKINNHSNLNENDELKWIKDIEPSFYTLVIDLGEKISRAKYKKVMLKLDSMGYKGWHRLTMNVRDKLLVNRFGPKPIIHFYPGFRYLILGPTGEIPEKEISHTNLIRKYPSLDVIPVNDFLNQPINESNDLQWIKDVETLKFRPKVGDYIEVRNKGNIESYYSWLGQDFRMSYNDGLYGDNIQGKVIPETQKAMRGKGFNIIEDNTGDVIFFPYHEYMLEYADTHNEFKDLDLEYYPL